MKLLEKIWTFACNKPYLMMVVKIQEPINPRLYKLIMGHGPSRKGNVTTVTTQVITYNALLFSQHSSHSSMKGEPLKPAQVEQGAKYQMRSESLLLQFSCKRCTAPLSKQQSPNTCAASYKAIEETEHK